MKLTVRQKRQIAKIAVEKSECIENGRIQIWFDGLKFSATVGTEYRDDVHKRVAVLNVWNENKPYFQSDFIRQLDTCEEEAD